MPAHRTLCAALAAVRVLLSTLGELLLRWRRGPTARPVRYRVRPGARIRSCVPQQIGRMPDARRDPQLDPTCGILMASVVSGEGESCHG
jgi:hypothetical protein